MKELNEDTLRRALHNASNRTGDGEALWMNIDAVVKLVMNLQRPSIADRLDALTDAHVNNQNTIFEYMEGVTAIAAEYRKKHGDGE